MDGNTPIPKLDGSRRRSAPRPLLAAVAVLVLTLVASCGGASGSGGGQQAAESGGKGAPAKEEQALGRPALGDADAPVVLTEYADYQ